MSKKKAILFGASGTADLVYHGMQNDPYCEIEISAFCVDQEYFYGECKEGLPVVRFEEVEKIYPPDKFSFLVAIGYHGMNTIREQKCRMIANMGYKLSGFIDSRVDMASSVEIGENVFILKGAHVGPFSHIGDNVCIFAGAVVSHHANIGNNVWISPGTVIAGNTIIGNNCFLGINSTIGQNIHIGNNNFLGANALVTKDTTDDSVYIVPNTPKYKLSTSLFMKWSGF